MKEETAKEIRESRYAEQHLREKYKDEPTKIIELLRAKLKKVEEVQRISTAGIGPTEGGKRQLGSMFKRSYYSFRHACRAENMFLFTFD